MPEKSTPSYPPTSTLTPRQDIPGSGREWVSWRGRRRPPWAFFWGGITSKQRDSWKLKLSLVEDFYRARRRIQWRTSSYSGTAVGRVLKTFIRPRLFNSRTALCTADFDRPVALASCCRLSATRFCSWRNSAVQRMTYTRKAKGAWS